MPKRKLTLQEVEKAFQTLKDAGISTSVDSVDTSNPVGRSFAGVPEPPKVRKPSPYGQIDGLPRPGKPVTHIKMTLRAKHSVGSGGVQVEGGDGKQVEHSGVETYGPGVCMVPISLVEHLAHQDQLAVQADEDFLSREVKSRLIVHRRDGSGNRANVYINVSEDQLDPGFILTGLPLSYSIPLR